MRIERAMIRSAMTAAAIGLSLILVAPMDALAAGFEESLARVDRALKSNPRNVHSHALESCHKRRAVAARLYYSGNAARAERSLKYCFVLLDLPEKAVAPPPVDKSEVMAKAIAKVQKQAALELEKAIKLEPDIDNGLVIYRSCAECHMPEGWGLTSGLVPQLAGQHRNVVIKQLADIRAGNRDNPLMAPYSSIEAIGGVQSVADVAGYIDTLEISTQGGKGNGDDLELGASVYEKNCAKCHGEKGEGNNDEFAPRIQSQHYNYLVYQFERIKNGERRNANDEMVAQIKDFSDQEMHAVLDYVSRLEPPEDLRAPEGWRNPDFLDVAVGESDTSATSPTGGDGTGD
jgi:cytochrome c553